MPKKISNVEMEQWLADYERGKPTQEIARDAHRDVRTVRKRIDQVRKELENRTVRRELMKEALLNHNKQLLQFVTNIGNALVVPGYELYIPNEKNRFKFGIQLGGALAVFDSQQSLSIRLNSEDDLGWRLIMEHLRDDPVVLSITDWKKAMVVHLNARIAFKDKAKELIQLKTGLKVIDKSGDELKEPGISFFTVDLYYEVIIKTPLGVPDSTNLEENILYTLDGYILHGKAGSKLAFAPENGQVVCDRMKKAVGNLYECDEIKKVQSTYYVATEKTESLREGFEELALIGLLPGVCRVCKRIGV